MIKRQIPPLLELFYIRSEIVKARCCRYAIKPFRRRNFPAVNLVFFSDNIQSRTVHNVKERGMG